MPMQNMSNPQTNAAAGSLAALASLGAMGKNAVTLALFAFCRLFILDSCVPHYVVVHAL